MFIGLVLPNESYSKGTTKKSSQSSSKKSKSSKSSSKGKSSKKSKKKKSKKNRDEVETQSSKKQPTHLFLADTILSKGVIYKRVILTIKGKSHDVHILQADLSNPFCNAEVLKAKNNNTELLKLQEIVKYRDSLSTNKTMGAINGNFWKAYSNYPIGPLIVGGEIVEMHAYKQWSSTFFNEQGLPFTSFFTIDGAFRLKNGKAFDISSVNRRSDSNGIVLYNKFGGDTIPYVNEKRIKQKLAKGPETQYAEDYFNDSTEAEFDVEKYKKELISNERTALSEYSIPKIAIEYMNEPAVNQLVYGKVIAKTNMAMATPKNGCIVSLGRDFPENLIPKIGDTISYRFKTNIEADEKFVTAVSGTPRLVRDGKAEQEARKEGSKGKRFIKAALPRTAIGYDKNKKKLYLVTIEAGNKKYNCTGASLDQLANIMKYIGCYNAMNLDGGGSSIMVIDGKNVMNSANPDASRRVSVGLGLINRISGAEQIINKTGQNSK